MLWETTDPAVALGKRFHFATPTAAKRWLTDTVAHTYGIAVASVDRLVMSAYNLLAWLTTAEGPLLAKCCAFAPAHQCLQNAAALVVWLDQVSLPVSVPLTAKTGAVQVRCDHLSVGVQRVIPGELLDPSQPAQTCAAGLTLAQLHQALARYPQTSDFLSPTPVPSLPTLIDTWLTGKISQLTEPAILAGCHTLQQLVQQMESTALVPQLVHGDYRAANLLWHEGKIRAVLDFEEVCWGYRVNDLAWAAVHLGTRYHNWGPVMPEVHRTFLNSYTAHSPLATQEQPWLLPLLTWHSLALACSATGRPIHAAGLDAVSFYTQLLQSTERLIL